VVSRDFQALGATRAARARLLAGRYPASGEALLFYAEIASLQGRLAGSLPPQQAAGHGFALDALLPGRQALAELVEGKGPEKLREQVRRYDETACRESLRAYFTGQDTTSPRSFFARVLLQPAMFAWASAVAGSDTGEQRHSAHSADGSTQGEQRAGGADGGRDTGRASVLRNAEWIAGTPPPGEAPRSPAVCPRCGHGPQAGCLRPQGDGAALALVCSLCLHEWPFARVRCPACGSTDHQKISYYSTPEFAHLEVQVCESCQAYLHLVDLSKEKEAIPDVDELAALPLDLWALEKGYWKVQPNLTGI
jgi:formate dehydrogenase maturation protein FdhE